MTGRYILVEKRAVLSEDPAQITLPRPLEERLVAKTWVGRALVLTEFLGIDQSDGEDEPELFKTTTMINGGEVFSASYPDWTQAEVGHMEEVDRRLMA